LLKTNVYHFEIILPVLILAFLQSLACNSAPAYQILYELDDQRQSYDIISIFQDGGHTVANLLYGLRLTFLKVQSYSHTKFRPNISIHG